MTTAGTGSSWAGSLFRLSHKITVLLFAVTKLKTYCHCNLKTSSTQEGYIAFVSKAPALVGLKPADYYKSVKQFYEIRSEQERHDNPRLLFGAFAGFVLSAALMEYVFDPSFIEGLADSIVGGVIGGAVAAWWVERSNDGSAFIP